LFNQSKRLHRTTADQKVATTLAELALILPSRTTVLSETQMKARFMVLVEMPIQAAHLILDAALQDPYSLLNTEEKNSALLIHVTHKGKIQSSKYPTGTLNTARKKLQQL